MNASMFWRVTAFLAATATAPASSTEVLAPGSIVLGRSIAAWSADWWTWAWNSPASADPLGDTSGVLANQNNNGPVFFLAGSNSNGVVQRSFDVPHGKPVLVPMINYWENCPGDVAVSCGQGYVPDPKPVMIGNSAYYQGAVTSLFAVIDGTPVANPFAHWEVSDFFSGGVAAAGTTIVGLYASFWNRYRRPGHCAFVGIRLLRHGHWVGPRPPHHHLWWQYHRVWPLRLSGLGISQRRGGAGTPDAAVDACRSWRCWMGDATQVCDVAAAAAVALRVVRLLRR